MALRDLKSNLKTLKVDKDRPGGGSSGLPYIKGGLPEDSPAGEYIADLARYSSDGTVRGGLFSTVSSTTDSIRISRFLNDSPKGLLFTSKQIGLQKSNPLIETETRGEKINIEGLTIPNINTQVYSNSNLLAQIAVQGTGEHIPRSGFNVNNLRDDKNKYEEIVSKKPTNQNRLVNLYDSKINKILNISSNDLNKLGISDNPEFLFNYTGGPGSSYGDGNTEIKRSVNTSGSYSEYLNNPLSYSSGYDPSFEITSEGSPYAGDTLSSEFNKIINLKDQNVANAISTAAISTFFPNLELLYASAAIQNKINNNPNKISDSYSGSLAKRYEEGPDFIRPEKSPEGYTFDNTMAYSKLLGSELGVLQDFRQQTDASILADSVNYTKGGLTNKGFNMEARIGIGNPGGRDKISGSKDNFYIEYKEGQDKINMSPIYRRHIKDPVENDSKDVRDLIKFVIESIDNGYPDETNRLHFRAYITNFSDNIGADWNSQRYMGRGENFYTYQGFTREVGFTFIVAAQSVQEMEKMYQKLNYLASTLHPDYSPGGFMRGTIHQLTIGEYFYRTPGIITSMNITVEDNYPWETKMSQPESKRNSGDPTKDDRGQMEVPQILKIQMNFKPIMNRLPQKGFQEPILVSAGRNVGSYIANNYLEREDFKEWIRSVGGISVDTDGIISKK